MHTDLCKHTMKCTLGTVHFHFIFHASVNMYKSHNDELYNVNVCVHCVGPTSAGECAICLGSTAQHRLEGGGGEAR